MIGIQLVASCLRSACAPDATSASAFVNIHAYIVYVPVAVALLAALAWGSTIISPLLEHPVLQELGNASYAIYILQWATWELAFDWRSSPPGWLAAWIAVLCTIAVAIAVHRYVETPLREMLRGRARPHGPAQERESVHP